MNLLQKIFLRLRYLVSEKEEKGTASAGFLPPQVRNKAVSLIDIDKGKLLEIGCGEGLFIIMVAKKFTGIEITGVEISENTKEVAERKVKRLGLSNVRLMIGKAERTGFENSTFDRVVCLNMLYNLNSKQNVEDVINEMARVCKEDGSIIFDIRNRSNPLVRLAYKKVKSYDPKCPWPLNAYTLKEAKDILKNHNLKIKNVIPIVKILGVSPLAYLIEVEKR